MPGVSTAVDDQALRCLAYRASILQPPVFRIGCSQYSVLVPRRDKLFFRFGGPSDPPGGIGCGQSAGFGMGRCGESGRDRFDLVRGLGFG